MAQFYNENKKAWDEFARIHFQSDHYRVKEFLKGESSLKTIELEELTDVKGKTLIHLQCHFGLDTLSWAREGAIVTGVDFSKEAIELAKTLAQKASINAKFIESNIYDIPEKINEKFDVVYTSFGVICWLHDIKKWAEIIASLLKPGGTFYFAEFHPFAMVFDDEHKKELTLRYNYFHNPEPMKFEIEGTYADKNAKIDQKTEYEWAHSMSDIINAIINAGLKIDFVNEYPFTCYEAFPFTEKDSDGYWRLKNQKAEIPLIFTLKARKE